MGRKGAMNALNFVTHENQERKYKGFSLFDELPSGWRFDKTAGSPLHGFEFATDGKSILRGGKRALVRVIPAQINLFKMELVCQKIEPPIIDEKILALKIHKPIQVVDAIYARTVNELARQHFKAKILNDMLVDLQICEIEGWCKTEYLKELRELINSIGSQACIEN